MAKKTFDDVLDELCDTNDIAVKCAARLKEAHERELASKDARIALLEAAMKPVLGVHISQDDMTLEVYDSEMDGKMSVKAVREAQCIYKAVMKPKKGMTNWEKFNGKSKEAAEAFLNFCDANEDECFGCPLYGNSSEPMTCAIHFLALKAAPKGRRR